MKQVIIIAPQFPPSNLTAGHRSRYFGTHLSKFGWKVKILSVRSSCYEGNVDPELEKLLPPDLEIIRTNAMPVRPLRIIGDLSLRAFWWHYKVLCDLARKEKIDLIYIPIPPNYSALLGLLMYHKFGIPYGIDYIDPWISVRSKHAIPFSKPWLSDRLGRILEPLVLRHASLITAVSPGTYERALDRYSWLNKKHCVALPYGAEEMDLKYLDRFPRPPYLFDPSDGCFHIVYAGTMWLKAKPTLEALLQGLVNFKKRFPSIAGKLKIHFIGTGTNPNDPKSFTVKPLAKQHEMLDMISEYPKRIPYLDTLNHLKNAHAALILGSSETHYTPSKVFQLILTRRPMIAILHSESTAVDIIKETKSGEAVTFNGRKPVSACVDEIAEAIYKAFNDYSPQSINLNTLYAYSAQKITERLARAFDTVLSEAH